MDDYLIEVLEKNGFSYHKHHTIPARSTRCGQEYSV